MTRDEFILSMKPTINNLLRKYHHYGDEDLFQTAMVDVIAGYDRCIEENITNIEEQRKMCNTYAKYAILNELKKRNRDDAFFDVMDEEEIDEPTVTPMDAVELNVALEQTLTPEELKFLRLLQKGVDRQFICSVYNISEKTFYIRKTKLFEKIKKILQN